MCSVGIRPHTIYADRFSVGSLRDSVADRWSLVSWVARWPQAREDIAGFRRLVAHGPFSAAPECRGLARLGLRQAAVATDDQGSVRIVQRRGSQARDEFAVAASLSCGAWVRASVKARPRLRFALAGQELSRGQMRMSPRIQNNELTITPMVKMKTITLKFIRLAAPLSVLERTHSEKVASERNRRFWWVRSAVAP